ncbi:MAG TPA: hypothetical protein VIG48_09855 [Jatrophihabitans sp.]
MTPSDGRLSHRVAVRRGEVRFIPALAVVVAAAIYAALPHDLLFGPRWLIPVIEAALLVSVVLVNPTRITTETRWSRLASLALAMVLIVMNTVSVGLLIRDLTAAHPTPGRELLVAALQVWITNMIAFALLYWDLDAGGAVARLPSSAVPAKRHDFWFPQNDPGTARLALGAPGVWMPVFVDYLYLSITNSVAFSPTDTLPLTSRAKVLMAVQSLAAMVTSLLVIARAVNVLR